MDIFGTTITVMHEVYNITIFIRGVIADIKAYDSSRREIQDKLEHEILFLSAFRDIFFEKGAVMRNEHLHLDLKHDVHNILTALRKALTEYGMLAAKHGLLDGENNWPEHVNEQSTSFSDRIKLKVKDLRRTVDWALFDREKIMKTLAEYSEWTGRLRQTMSLVLLTLSAFGSSPLEDFARSERVKEMGLEEVVNRQLLAHSKPPEDFQGLSGRVVEGSKLIHDADMKSAKYMDDWGRDEEVMVEYRKYSKELIRAVFFRLPERDKLKEPIRNLAWLLHKASLADDKDDNQSATSHDLGIYTLQCIGYIDQPENNQTMFLYQLPKPKGWPRDPKIMTLHNWINTTNLQSQHAVSKPSLGNRFFLAYALCITLLNIHGSGWIHKNISSCGIVVFPSLRSLSRSEILCSVPYLMDWGLSRPITEGTDLTSNTDVEPNFYRHPVRQGYPETPFKVQHDIYALGVVLLEIGMWKTVGSIFKTQIEKATAERRLPAPNMIKEALVEKARTEIASEMGDSYAKSVERCLDGQFGVDDENESATVLSAAFRRMVIDTIAKGMEL